LSSTVTDPRATKSSQTFERAWKEVWGSSQGVGSVGKIVAAAELIARFKKEYDEATDPPL
jgi:hypothetical protein